MRGHVSFETRHLTSRRRCRLPFVTLCWYSLLVKSTMRRRRHRYSVNGFRVLKHLFYSILIIIQTTDLSLGLNLDTNKLVYLLIIVIIIFIYSYVLYTNYSYNIIHKFLCALYKHILLFIGRFNIVWSLIYYE